MTALIESLRTGVPPTLSELTALERTLTTRVGDILAYFDRPSTSKGPKDAINRRLEHLRGTALDFRNLTHYIARSLLETSDSREPCTLVCEEPTRRRRVSDTASTVHCVGRPP